MALMPRIGPSFGTPHLFSVINGGNTQIKLFHKAIIRRGLDSR